VKFAANDDGWDETTPVSVFLFLSVNGWVGSRDVYHFLISNGKSEAVVQKLLLILLVDGSHRTTLRDLLRLHGYQAVMAESDHDFLMRIQEEARPALLLMDFPTLGRKVDDFFDQKVLVDSIGSIPLLSVSGLTDFIERFTATTLLPDPTGVAFLLKLVETALSPGLE
jgi:response regulator RpfG family c-di-GMP phosphodiesterase